MAKDDRYIGMCTSLWSSYTAYFSKKSASTDVYRPIMRWNWREEKKKKEKETWENEASEKASNESSGTSEERSRSYSYNKHHYMCTSTSLFPFLHRSFWEWYDAPEGCTVSHATMFHAFFSNFWKSTPTGTSPCFLFRNSISRRTPCQTITYPESCSTRVSPTIGKRFLQ